MLEYGHHVIGIDSETYACKIEYLDKLQKNKRFKYQYADISKLEFLPDCHVIINAAAETHVDNSIADSSRFMISNVLGVHNILRLMAAKKEKPHLMHFSTDEVYGDIKEGSHTEDSILRPSNPYAASKAAADQLIMAWHRTYGIQYTILRPTNNYGIGQNSEKLIPRTIRNVYLLNTKIPLHQKGTPKRTWLHVEDTASAVLYLFYNLDEIEINCVYNIAGSFEMSNIDMVKEIFKHFKIYDSYYHLDSFAKNREFTIENYVDFTYDREGQDVRYSIDGSKLQKLGWKPVKNFDESMRDIVMTTIVKGMW